MKKLLITYPTEDTKTDSDMYELEFTRYHNDEPGVFELSYSPRYEGYTPKGLQCTAKLTDIGDMVEIEVKDYKETNTIHLDYSELAQVYTLLRVYMKEDDQDIRILSCQEEY